MDFSRRIAQLLHEDHRATIAQIESLEQMIHKAKRNAPDVNDPQINKILKQAHHNIEHEVRSHFSFEEDELFTRLAAAGDVSIGEHLREEHRAILPLGEQVSEHAKLALDSGFSAQSWDQFRDSASELIERMLTHIQKEEMALLPLIDDLIDPQTDMELADHYSNNF
jgi:hemerythrin-like domain-containing protein